jgi:capsular polysaccharide biosynthesis protein
VPLRTTLQILRRRLWVVVLAMVPVRLWALPSCRPHYEASTKIMIRRVSRFEDDYVQPASELQALTKTMAEAVVERFIANVVILKPDLPMSPSSLLANRCKRAYKRRRPAPLPRKH